MPEQPRSSRTAHRLRRRTEALLEVDHVTLRFGGVVALNDVSFAIYEGEILGLIGPNGAGKTTCFNAMTGVYKPTSGEIRFDGQPITGTQAAPDHPARHRPDVPEHPAVPRDDRAGERHGRRRRPPQDQRARRAVPAYRVKAEEDELPTRQLPRRSSRLRQDLRHLPARARGAGRPAEGAWSCCASSASPTGPTSWRATCPTATSAGSRSPGRWPPSRSCSAWTSRPPASTRRRRRT